MGLAISYFTYVNHPALKRIEDSLFLRNVPIAEHSFPDPAGAYTETGIDEEGMKQLYLVHEERKLKLDRYLLPETDYLLDRFQRRACRMEKDEAEKTLDSLLKIKKSLYSRM
jgi:hypothetical protein